MERPRRVVRFVRLIHTTRPRSWRTCGPRRLRRQSEPDSAATQCSEQEHGTAPGVHDQVARELDLTETAVRQWVRQADLDAGRRSDGLTTVERDELRRLRRENRDLREEREIPRMAAVFFASMRA
jgi:transposase